MSPEELQNRLLEFAVTVGKLVDKLPDTTFGRQIGYQLVKSGSSPMANYADLPP